MAKKPRNPLEGISTKGFKTHLFKVDEELDGSYAISYGKRCLWVALTESELDAYVAGLKEGLTYERYPAE